MKINIRNSITVAAIVMVGISSPAFAGGVQVDDTSLTDVLVAKGILSKGDVQAIEHNKDGKLKLEATLFLNTTRKNDKVTIAPVAQTETKTTGLNVDRAYLTAKYSFTDDWMARLTLDMANQSPVAGLSKDQAVFVKYAYVQGKLLGDAVVLRLGQSHTPWIDYQEHQNKHRYVFKTFVDNYGFETSSDLGIGLKGKLANGLVGYWTTVTNGTGYSNGNAQSGNNGLDFDARISLFPLEHVSLDLQYVNGFRASKTFKSNIGVAGRKSTMYQIQGTYITHDYGIGVGYVNNKDVAKDATGYNVKHGVTTVTLAAANDKLESDGFYVWGRAKLPINNIDLGMFGTYEYLKNKTQQIIALAGNPEEKITRYVFGLEYWPVKHIAFSAVADIENVDQLAGVANNKRNISKFGLYSEVEF